MAVPLRVIAFVCLKGGVGKSTLAIAVACEWARRGYRVVLVDMDPKQRSVAKWLAIRKQLGVKEGPSVILGAGDLDELDANFDDLVDGYEIVIIDTPGELGERPVFAAGKADLAIMPCGPNGIEVNSLPETFVEISGVRRLRKSLDAAVLITRKQANTIAGRIAFKAYEDARYKPLETELDMRADYDGAYSAGLGPTTWRPSGKAAAEVRKLVKELDRRLSMPAPKSANKAPQEKAV